MFRFLRLFFTFSGIVLLLSTITISEWTSMTERLSYAGMAICMLAICQPSATYRVLRSLSKGIASLFHFLLNCFNTKGITRRDIAENSHEIEDNHGHTMQNNEPPASPDILYDYRDYRIPVEISQGNIVPFSDEQMNVLLRYYYKADEIKTKVKGVTYRNNDGTDRQTILSHCHAGDQLRFESYRYDGAPAYAVYCDWGQIGNLSAELAEEIADKVSAMEKPYLILGEILNVSGGYHGEYFGCNICLTIYEKY